MKEGLNELVEHFNSETGRIELQEWASATAKVVVSSFKIMAQSGRYLFGILQEINAASIVLQVGRSRFGTYRAENLLKKARNEFNYNRDQYQDLLAKSQGGTASARDEARMAKLAAREDVLAQRLKEAELRLVLAKTKSHTNIDRLANAGLPGDPSAFDGLLKQLDEAQGWQPKNLPPTAITDGTSGSIFDGKSGGGFKREPDTRKTDREIAKFLRVIERYYKAESRLAAGSMAIEGRALDAFEARLGAELDLMRTAGSTEEELVRAKAERMLAIDQERFDLHLDELRLALANEVELLRKAGISAEDTARLTAQTEALIDTEKATRRAQLHAQSAEFARQDLENSDSWAQGWQDGMLSWQQDLNSGFERAQELARETAQAMSQSFSDFFFDAMTGKLETFGDYMKSFLESIQRALSNIMGQMATRAVLGSFGMTVPGFATGGVVTQPTLATVGERGPEAIIPLASGAVPVRFEGAGTAAKAQPINLRVQVINRTGQQVQATVSDMRYDAALREFVVVTMIDAINRDVMGMGSMLRGAS